MNKVFKSYVNFTKNTHICIHEQMHFKCMLTRQEEIFFDKFMNYGNTGT